MTVDIGSHDEIVAPFLEICYLIYIFFCINSSGSDISKCQFYMDMLAECRRSSEKKKK
ncbi:hypothetical protein HanHA300_Chr16g0612861 [Helianthus annuus]|nr:hypothetical protein HanHA300_Chr16g0612861 [Helianthus annuus]KAJ0460668.1 hypothetical protein HanHA89_Chr16g0663461 [Helianthus annuus]